MKPAGNETPLAPAPNHARPRPVLPGTRHRGGFTLATVFGVELAVDWSLTLLFVLALVDLGGYVFPLWHPQWPATLAWGLALATALLFVGSIALHELAHTLVARRLGIPVRRITLFVFGGMSELEDEPRSASAELWMALAGPVVSLAIGFSANVAAQALLGGHPNSAEAMESLLRLSTPLETVLFWLGAINLMLGLFNLLPGFPLDGGRVLRAVLWAATHDRYKATRWATGAGRVIASLLMAIGLVEVLGGGLVDGLWLLLIGWFLNGAARATLERSTFRHALAGVAVRQLMRTDVPRLPPELSVQALAETYLLRSDEHVFPVERDGQLVGMVSRERVRALPASAWSSTSVSAIMANPDDMDALPPEASADLAFDRLTHGVAEEVPVVDHGHLVGVVEIAGMFRWLGLHAGHGAGT